MSKFLIICLHQLFSLTTIYISEEKDITKIKRKISKTENRQALLSNTGYFLGYASQTFRIECNKKLSHVETKEHQDCKVKMSSSSL